MTGKVNVGIIGASGYIGHELLKLLRHHSKADIKVLNSQSYAGKKVKHIYSDYAEDESYTGYSIQEINDMALDCVFLAVPNCKGMEIAMQLGKTKHIIDMSADYRFADIGLHEQIYQCGARKDIELVKQAVYGLPEMNKEKIIGARLVANPGCYVTASLIAAIPVAHKSEHLVFDAISGWSGAGRTSDYSKDPSLLKDNVKAYNIAKHRHKYEIAEKLRTLGTRNKAGISFTPHVFQGYRGLMVTLHALLNKEIKLGLGREECIKLYSKQYENSEFVIIQKKGLPEIKDVVNTPKCILGGFETDEDGQLVVIAVLDNLMKGAASQAIENMNLMLGYNQSEGLK